jgi:hypothetical protein
MRHLLAAGMLVVLAFAFAAEAAVAKKMRRRFPAQWCTMGDAGAASAQDFVFSFEATRDSGRLTFRGLTDSFGSTGIYLDALAVVTRSEYDAHVKSISCYDPFANAGTTVDPAPYFDRDESSGAGIVFEENFGGDLLARGWTLEGDARRDAIYNLDLPQGPDSNLQGALGLGEGDAASVEISGLVAGTTYVVAGWWLGFDGDNNFDLEIEVNQDVERWIPTAGSAGVFRTDTRIFNPNLFTIEVSAWFFPGGLETNLGVLSQPPQKFTVAPRSMKRLDDVVTLFQLTGLGAILFRSEHEFVGTTRAYANLPTGTLGQSLAVSDPGKALRRGVILQLKSLSGTPFRTNIGVLNIQSVNNPIVWSLYDRNDNLVATAEDVLEPYYVMTPTDIRTFFPNIGSADLSNAWVSFIAEQPVMAYGSVVDNRTTDPTTIPAEPDDGPEVIIFGRPGVAPPR